MKDVFESFLFVLAVINAVLGSLVFWYWILS